MSAKSSRVFPILAAWAAALAVAAALSTAAMAAEEDGTDPVPPDMAEETSGERSQAAGDDASSAEAPEAPVVQTRVEHGQTITEYRRQGRVFMMTVEPRTGPKQYWNDADGDGQFQRRTSPDLDENVNLPKWRLGGW